MGMVRRWGLILLLLAAFTLMACSGSSGLPAAPGTYQIKANSITYDGDAYSFLWADAAGTLTRARTDDIKLQLAEANVLEITANKEAILRLTQKEPVTVEGRDDQGSFSSFWFPFLAGQMLSRGPVVVNQAPTSPELRQPVYRYPPTDRFDRGDTIQGSTSSTSRGRAPVSDAVSGQSGGAGGGNAATNRAASSGASVSGQSGGTGSGSAALNKSGSFRSDASTTGVNRPSTGIPSVSAPKVSAPKVSVPKVSIRRR